MIFGVNGYLDAIQSGPFGFMRPKSTISYRVQPLKGFIVWGVVGEHRGCHADDALAVQGDELPFGEPFDLVQDIIRSHEVAEIRGILWIAVGAQQQLTHLLCVFRAGVDYADVFG